MNIDIRLVIAYSIIILFVISITLLIESPIQADKYLVASFGILAMLNIIFTALVSKIYSKYPSQLSALLHNNRLLLNAFTLIFLLLHFITSQLLLYGFNISLMLKYNSILGIIAGILASIIFIVILLTQLRILKILDPIFSYLPYLMIGLILIHFWGVGGFWASNFVFKIIVTLIILGLTILYNKW